MSIEKFGFDIVHGCQLKCIGCPMSTKNEKIKFMDLGLAKKMLANVDVRAVKIMRLFNFGEPLLHPQLPEMVELINEQPFIIRELEVSTNGQYYNEESLKKTFSIGAISQFWVSCDGDGTEKSYERLRPPAKFEKLIDFIEKVKILRDEYCPDMFLGTRTICNTNVGKVRWKKLLLPRGWEPDFRNMSNFPESELIKKKTINVGKGICKFLNYEIGGRRLYVDYDGTMVPCCRHPRALVLGNLLEGKYTEIINSEPYLRAVRSLKRRMYVPICCNCDHK